MDNNANWSLQEYAVVYNEYPVVGPVPIADKLDRTVNSVVGKAIKLGVDMPKEFTQEEINLAKTYGKQLGSALIFLLPHRTTVEVGELLKCVST